LQQFIQNLEGDADKLDLLSGTYLNENFLYLFLRIINKHKNYAMKKITLLLAIVGLFLTSTAQPPQGFNYQSVVRDATGDIVANQTFNFRLSIRNILPNGPILYREIQPATTNDFGLANLVIGQGAPVIGVFADINWRDGEKFLEVEVDLTGSFVSLGTSELFSVPYALYSGSDWLKDGFNLYYNNGNVGIGTNNPMSNLHISDPVNSTFLTLESNNFTTFRLKSLSSDYNIYGDDYSGSLSFKNNNSGEFNLKFSNDNVGVGNYIPPAGPAYKFEVLGDINYTGDLYQNGTLFTGGVWTKSGSDIYYNLGNVGIGTNSPTSNLHIFDPVNSVSLTMESSNFTIFRLKSLSSDYNIYGDDYSGSLSFKNNNTGEFNLKFFNDNVGVGNYIPPAGPAYKFEVLGDINLTGDLYQNGSLFTGGVWAKNIDDIYYDLGNVGIGISFMVAELHVNRDDAMTNSQIWVENDGIGDATVGFATGSSGGDWAVGVDQSDGVKFKIGQSWDVSLNTALTIDNNNRVGIGTTNPYSLLEVRYDDNTYNYLGYSEDRASYFYHRELEADGDGQAAIYAYRTRDSRNDGTSYGHNSSNGAIKGYSYWGDSYSYGVGGFNYNDYERSGGILGANSSGSYWGSLGYKNSSNTTYGGYFTSYTSGSGDNIANSGNGIGAWGDLFGADIHGKIYGTYTEGENYGLFSNGKVFKNDLDVHLQKTGNENTILYTNVSTEVTIQTSGYASLINGESNINFDESFSNAVSKSEPIIVTITPTGNSNGVYLKQVDSSGFKVVENNGGKSNVTITYIAIGKRAGYENPQLPQEVVDIDYINKLSRGLHNDNDTDKNGEGIYYKNSKLVVGTPPDALQSRNKPNEESVVPQPIPANNRNQENVNQTGGNIKNGVPIK